MDPYTIETEARVLRSLRRINPADQRRILNKIKGLATEPRPAGCEKLKGVTDAYRIRQGNYRIIYTINGTNNIITITKVGDRKDVYR